MNTLEQSTAQQDTNQSQPFLQDYAIQFDPDGSADIQTRCPPDPILIQSDPQDEPAEYFN
jgi:hypothetical protein